MPILGYGGGTANYRVTAALEMQDINGDRDILRIHSYAGDGETVANLQTAVHALTTAIGNPGNLSNAKVVSEGIAINVGGGNELGITGQAGPSSAEFATVQDKALLAFESASGEHRNIYLPAPVEAMFDTPPSDLIVNPIYSNLAPLITGIMAVITDHAGVAFADFTGATYMGRRRHRNKPRG